MALIDGASWTGDEWTGLIFCSGRHWTALEESKWNGLEGSGLECYYVLDKKGFCFGNRCAARRRHHLGTNSACSMRANDLIHRKKAKREWGHATAHGTPALAGDVLQCSRMRTTATTGVPATGCKAAGEVLPVIRRPTATGLTALTSSTFLFFTLSSMACNFGLNRDRAAR